MPQLLLKVTIILICISFTVKGYSQVCTGSLGDPVVSVDFGNGTNPGNPLSAATTTYSFTTSTCPNDGSYTIVSSTSGCFGNSWHTLSEDHTPGDVNGYMMLVNASFNPGDFYVDTVKGLCGNTKYEFGAWITNVLTTTSPCSPSIDPKLTFNIETITGTVLGTYSTGDIPETNSPSWLQYGLFFTTPVNNNMVVIRITNNAPGGCGNDLALDDITFRPCGPTVMASLTGTSPTSLDICSGTASPVLINATIGSGYIAPSMQWQASPDGISWIDIPGESSSSYLFNNSAIGVYRFRLTVAEGVNIASTNCRVASNVVTIAIHGLPVINASSSSPVCENTILNLTAGGGTTYNWTGPGGFTSSLATPALVAQTSSSGAYIVNVTDQYGCINQASTNVTVFPQPIVSVSGTQTVCEGISAPLNAGGGSSYSWYPAAGLSATNISNPIATPTDTTTYFVIVSNGNTCSDTASVIINILKRPFAVAGPDKILLKGQTIILDGIAGGSDVSFYWLPNIYLNSPLLMQPVTNAINDIKYTLHVSSNAGCGIAEDEVFVKVYNDIYVPNAFSPNNDGLNDTWRIDGLAAVPNARISVFNRYGETVFEGTGNTRQWDGKYKNEPLPVGSYTYMIDLKNGRRIMKGSVIIVR